jgi:hypothetical protein
MVFGRDESGDAPMKEPEQRRTPRSTEAMLPLCTVTRA